MEFFKITKRFKDDEDGAVTVDWVVLTAGIGRRVGRGLLGQRAAPSISERRFRYKVSWCLKCVGVYGPQVPRVTSWNGETRCGICLASLCATKMAQ